MWILQIFAGPLTSKLFAPGFSRKWLLLLKPHQPSATPLLHLPHRISERTISTPPRPHSFHPSIKYVATLSLLPNDPRLRSPLRHPKDTNTELTPDESDSLMLPPVIWENMLRPNYFIRPLSSKPGKWTSNFISILLPPSSKNLLHPKAKYINTSTQVSGNSTSLGTEEIGRWLQMP